MNWTTSKKDPDPEAQSEASPHEPSPNRLTPTNEFADRDDEVNFSSSQESPLTYENIDTSMNGVKLANLTASYNPGCPLVIPAHGERCHRFDNFGHKQAIPWAVLSA